MFEYELVHIGINTANEEDAENLSKKLSLLFNLKPRNGNKSYFAGNLFECMKSPYLGKNGHIALGVHNLEDAMEELKSHGITFLEDTIALNDEGKIKNVYIAEEFEGFAIHILELN